MNMLLCPNCGSTQTSVLKNAICIRCGNVAGIPPLTDGAFEKVGEDNEPIKSAKKKPVENRDKTPDDGGRAF